MNDDLRLAIELADLADGIAMSRFRASDLEIETKPDGSPVTDADGAVERALRARLNEIRPADAVVGEELGGSAEAPRCWYLDPIDGTSRFLAGEPEWYVLIALVLEGVPVAAVASAPALATRWRAARGEGAFRDGRPIRVSQTARLADATISDDWRGTLEREVPGEPLTKLAARCARVRPRNGHSMLALAEGQCDVFVGTGGFAWDYAPMNVIVEEAGGRFTDLSGADAIDTGHALVSNGLLHDEALAVLADGY